MKLSIVTDSTCDLPRAIVDEHGIEVIPCILIVDGQEYADGAGLSREEFYRRLPGFKHAPTTAAPSIGDFAVRYQKLIDQGSEHIISIHAAGLLTSMIDTARQAADEFPGRVTVVDSLSLSLGLGFQVLAAAEAAEAPEAEVHEALAAIESTRRRLHLFAALDTLEYVRRSGRVPAAITILGSVLSIKPVIELTEGQVKVVGAVRTRKQANERMLAFMRAGGKARAPGDPAYRGGAAGARISEPAHDGNEPDPAARHPTGECNHGDRDTRGAERAGLCGGEGVSAQTPRVSLLCRYSDLFCNVNGGGRDAVWIFIGALCGLVVALSSPCYNNRMQPSLEKLRKFFGLEREKKYDNSAIIGGLAKMLDYWEGEARADGVQEDVIQAVAQRLRSYEGLSPESRADVLRGLWKRISETYPEASQRSGNAPGRPPTRA